MPGTYTSPTTRARIFTLKEEKWRTKDIAARFGRDPSTIRRIIQRRKDGESFYFNKPKPGRPRKLDDEAYNSLIKFAEEEKWHDAADFWQQCNLPVSDHTVERYLEHEGFKAHLRPRKPLIDEGTALRRLLWANNYRARTIRFWNQVIFTDESKFNRIGSDGRRYFYCRHGEASTIGLDPHNSKKRVQGGGGSVFVWGCITRKGVGQIRCIQGKMNADVYQSILKDALVRTIHDYGLNPSRLLFQQDNDPKHKAKSTMAWLHSKGFRILPWPACSADMSIIEHVWDYLEDRIRERDHPPKNLDELWQWIEEEWYIIPDSYISSLYRSMTGRISELVDKDGWNTSK